MIHVCKLEAEEARDDALTPRHCAQTVGQVETRTQERQSASDYHILLRITKKRGQVSSMER